MNWTIQQHFQHIREAVLAVGTNRPALRKGHAGNWPASLHFDGRPIPSLGSSCGMKCKPHDPEHLRTPSGRSRKAGRSCTPGDFKEHLAALHDGHDFGRGAAHRGRAERLSAPNSPNKTHFMVELSPVFYADRVQQGHRPAVFHAAL